MKINKESPYSLDQFLILTQNSTDYKWKDSTEDIIDIKDSFYYGKKSGYLITFSNGKTYPYNFSSIRILKNPIVIEIHGKTVIADGSVYLLVSKVLKFGQYYKLFLLGNKTKVTTNFELKNPTINTEPNIFSYYKELSQYASQLQDEEITVQGIICGQYENIEKIHAQSVLKAYMTKTSQTYSFIDNNIFPFNFNISQKKAVEQALSNQVSIIEGPPGCGKTQTILNLIANLLVLDKKIAVVSNNNTAIKNVSDKLSEEGVGFLCALLGNSENKTIFFDNINNDKLKEFVDSYDELTNKPNEKFTLYYYGKLLDKLYEKENEKAQLIVSFDSISKEYHHFKIKHEETLALYTKFKVIKLLSNDYLRLKAFIDMRKGVSFFDRILLRFKYRIKYKKLKNINHLSLIIEKNYYDAKINEIESNIKNIEKYLEKNAFESIKKEYIDESRKHLNNVLIKKYRSLVNEEISRETHTLDFNKFIKRYPLILSTSHSILYSIKDEFLFDYLIVDEASQSELLSSVLAMSCAKNIVVVGDSKQLDQIDNQDIYEASEKLAAKYKIEGEFLYKDNALLGAIKKVFPNAPITLLKEHYRCHPTIINYVNQRFYNNELVVLTKNTEHSPITLITLVEGNHARRNPNGSGQYNQREIDEVLKYIKEHEFKNIGIISPFKIQAEMYKNVLEDEEVEVDTVHKFQGRQKETIILSTVINDIELTEKNERFIDFINNPKLFNVALSRAQKHIALVGTQGLFNSNNNNFADFIKYARYNTDDANIVKGNVTSVFDLLYSDYTNELNELIIRTKKRKLIASELLIYDLLDKVLKKYTNLKIAMHISLNKIVSDLDIFDEQEKKYLKNNMTHVDFIIYNSLTKVNLLAIEVDGIKYHQQSRLQTVRDGIKNKALEYNEIRLIRLATNKSNERMVIEKALNEILARK